MCEMDFLSKRTKAPQFTSTFINSHKRDNAIRAWHFVGEISRLPVGQCRQPPIATWHPFLVCKTNNFSHSPRVTQDQSTSKTKLDSLPRKHLVGSGVTPAPARWAHPFPNTLYPCDQQLKQPRIQAQADILLSLLPVIRHSHICEELLSLVDRIMK